MGEGSIESDKRIAASVTTLPTLSETIEPLAEVPPLGSSAEDESVDVVEVPVDSMILLDNPFRSAKNHSNRLLNPGNLSRVSGSRTITANNGISPTRDLMGRAVL